jgi:hypothetical protein
MLKLTGVLSIEKIAEFQTDSGCRIGAAAMLARDS